MSQTTRESSGGSSEGSRKKRTSTEEMDTTSTNTVQLDAPPLVQGRVKRVAQHFKNPKKTGIDESSSLNLEVRASTSSSADSRNSKSAKLDALKQKYKEGQLSLAKALTPDDNYQTTVVKKVRSAAVTQTIEDGHAPEGGFTNPEDRAAWTDATLAPIIMTAGPIIDKPGYCDMDWISKDNYVDRKDDGNFLQKYMEINEVLTNWTSSPYAKGHPGKVVYKGGIPAGYEVENCFKTHKNSSYF